MCSLTAMSDNSEFHSKWSSSPDQRKCGEVSLSLETTSLTVYCSFCEFYEESLECFLEHLKHKHYAMLAIETILWPEATSNELCIKQEELEIIEDKIQDEINIPLDGTADPLMAEEKIFDCCAVKTEVIKTVESDEGDECEKRDSQDDPDVQLNSEAGKAKFQHVCRLIHYIQEHPTLWNTQLASHYVRSDRQSAIESITTLILKEFPNLSIDTKYVRKKFKDLKKVYFNFHKSKTKPNKNYERYYELLHFLKDHEKTEESKNMCKVCNKDVACLPSHMQKYHCKNDIPNYFKCDTCEEMLPSIEHLQKHIRVVHRRYDCKHCTRKPYTNPRSLRRHMESNHPEIELPRKHSFAFVGPKERICEHCGLQFKSQNNLYLHIRRVHLQLRPHVCPDCPKAFKDHEKLKSHRNSAHLNNREHVCDVCSKAFFDRKTMVQHKRLHSDVMKYVCRVCGKAFRQAPALHSHMKTHQ